MKNCFKNFYDKDIEISNVYINNDKPELIDTLIPQAVHRDGGKDGITIGFDKILPPSRIFKFKKEKIKDFLKIEYRELGKEKVYTYIYNINENS